MAVHLKDAAKWSAKRLAGPEAQPEQYALKLREGVSIYYNLVQQGPQCLERPQHREAADRDAAPHRQRARRRARGGELEGQLRELRGRMADRGVMTASFQGN
jgi:hypothetical protein